MALGEAAEDRTISVLLDGNLRLLRLARLVHAFGAGAGSALWSRAIAAGAVARHQLAVAFWGERHGQLTDPFGHRWNIAQRLRDVPDDEIVAAAAQAFGG